MIIVFFYIRATFLIILIVCCKRITCLGMLIGITCEIQPNVHLYAFEGKSAVEMLVENKFIEINEMRLSAM